MLRVDTWLREAVRKLRCGIVPAADRPVPNLLRFPGIRIFLALYVFQHRGKLLASGGADGLVYVWQLRGSLRSAAVHEAALTAGVTSLVWAPNDQYIAVGDESGGVRVFFDNLKFNMQTVSVARVFTLVI